MRVYFYKTLEWIRLLFGVMPRSGFGSKKVFLILHYVFVGLVALILGLLSSRIAPDLSQGVPGFLGWLALVLYIIVRLVLVLVGLLGLEDESEFPDIEEDWNEIQEALRRERLAVDDLPLFMTNGLTPQQEEAVFGEASNTEWTVVAPLLTKKNATVRAFVSQEAIFLSCTGIGATCLQLGKVQTAGDVSPGPVSADMAQPPRAGTGTIQPGALAAQASAAAEESSDLEPPPPAAPIAAAPAAAPRGGFLGTMTPGALKRAMQTMQGLMSAEVKGRGKQQLTPLDDMECEIGRRRLAFLCRLLMEKRQPFCGANGMLQVLPFSWTQDLDYGRKLVPAIRADIEEIHQQLQMQLPVVIAGTELEQISGIQDFIMRSERLQPGLRHSRAGSSFSAGAVVDDKNAGWLVSQGVMQWFRGWVYQAFHADIDSPKNRPLFAMLCEISQRSETFTKLLRDILQDNVQSNRLRLYGVYLCASDKGSQKQGFIQGVLQKLIDLQGEVAYTPQVRQQQQRAGYWTVGSAG